MAVGDDTVVIVGTLREENYAWSSVDGRSWIRRAIDPPPSISSPDVVWTQGSFVLTGSLRSTPSGNTAVMTSSGGRSWEFVEPQHEQWVRFDHEAAGGNHTLRLARTYFPERHKNYCVLYGCGSSTSKLLAFDGSAWLESNVPFEADWRYTARVMEADGETLVVMGLSGHRANVAGRSRPGAASNCRSGNSGSPVGMGGRERQPASRRRRLSMRSGLVATAASSSLVRLMTATGLCVMIGSTPRESTRSAGGNTAPSS